MDRLRKLEKRAEHDDEARSSIHVVKTREKYIHSPIHKKARDFVPFHFIFAGVVK